MNTIEAAGRRLLGATAIGLICGFSGIAVAQSGNDIPIAEKPLVLGTEAPGNLFLVPSIEWPTMNTVANFGSFDPDEEYVGYFNSENCYEYQYSLVETERHWDPVSNTTNNNASDFACTGNDEWSGNFLNWAATQNIDPFRRALMGGYRFKDTVSETWLQKAKHTGQGGTAQYPDRSISDSSVVEAVTPFDNASSIHVRVEGIGNSHPDDASGNPDTDRVTSPMRFWLNGTGDRGCAVPYNPNGNTAQQWVNQCGDPNNNNAQARETLDAQVRVEVCNPNAGGSIDQDLCREYPNGNYKPEGLIQEFARLDNDEGTLRYSLFTYLNDSDNLRDGGVMRARQKYVGPQKTNPETGATVSNSDNQEWDENTGVLKDNPDSSDEDATSSRFSSISLDRSGLINYLGAAGQMNTHSYKSKDPVSELYYQASRYMRGLEPVSAYNEIPRPGQSLSDENVSKQLDGFPVIKDWDDPLEDYACAANAAVTIGDVFTHHDKNLPGNPSGAPGSRNTEPNYWSELATDENDNGIDVISLTNQIGTIQPGIGNSLGERNSFTGRENSAYIAGLAYDLHTRDQRTGQNMIGDQTLETFAVDVVENQRLEPENDNQYYLAAKFGGFEIRALSGVGGLDDFDPMQRTSDLPDAAWTDGDSVSAGGRTYNKKPRNFFLANQPEQVADSLRKAFTALAQEASGSSASVAANSTSAGTDSLIYQAQFDSSDWTGNVFAYNINSDGTLGGQAWGGGVTIPDPDNRTVYALDSNDDANELTRDQGNMPQGLKTTQQNALDTSGQNLPGDDGERADYLFFGASYPEFRNRSTPPMGDIVNSNPSVATGGNFGYSVLPGNAGSSYNSFLSDKRSKDEVLFVGANDGMLHAFDADKNGGEENYAVVPNQVIGDMPALSDPDYSHQKYVDGPVTVADAYWNSSWGEAVIASTGGGPKSGEPTVFAMDVTRTSSSAPEALWQLTGADSSNLGHVLENMDIVRMSSGNFAAVFGNGYNSDNGGASLFIVPLKDNLDFSDDATVITTGATPSAGGEKNGLGGVSTVDVEGDGIVEYVYAGDLQGNMWRFDVSSSSPSDWTNSANITKVFEAEDSNGNTQPITAAPRVTTHPDADVKFNVLFGTGRFFGENDNTIGSSPTVQSFYSLQDDLSVPGSGNLISGRGSLTEREILSQTTTDNKPDRRKLSDDSTPTQEGWYIDLEFTTSQSTKEPTGPQGERVVDTPVLVGNRVFFSTQIPETGVCSFGGNSWLMEMNAHTGGRTDTQILGGVNDPAVFGGARDDQMTFGGTVVGAGDMASIYRSGGGGNPLVTQTPQTGSKLTGRQSWRQLE
jgi:type IV pilus assembly protein PilY1